MNWNLKPRVLKESDAGSSTKIQLVFLEFTFKGRNFFPQYGFIKIKGSNTFSGDLRPTSFLHVLFGDIDQSRLKCRLKIVIQQKSGLNKHFSTGGLRPTFVSQTL